MGSLTVCLSYLKIVMSRKFLLFSFIDINNLSIYVGNGRKSSGNCFKTHFFWTESIYLLSNMVVHCNSGCLLSFAGELLEQGKF